MKTSWLVVLIAALFAGCSERVASGGGEGVAPVISTPVVKREAEFVPATAQPAPAVPSAASVPDFKDSSAALDKSR